MEGVGDGLKTLYLVAGNQEDYRDRNVFRNALYDVEGYPTVGLHW